MKYPSSSAFRASSSGSAFSLISRSVHCSSYGAGPGRISMRERVRPWNSERTRKYGCAWSTSSRPFDVGFNT